MSEQLPTTPIEKPKALENYNADENIEKYKNADEILKLQMFRDSMSELKSRTTENNHNIPSNEDLGFLEDQYMIASPNDQEGMYHDIQGDITAAIEKADSKKEANESDSELSVSSLELNPAAALNSTIASVAIQAVTAPKIT